MASSPQPVTPDAPTRAVDSPEEERASLITHAIGLCASVAAAVVLIVKVSLQGTGSEIVACSLYGATLILAYAASTAFHACPHSRARHLLRIIDHGSVFLLIAGTYTPFTLGFPSVAWGWALFGVTWGIAGLGVVAKLFSTGRLVLLSTFGYLALGWVCLVAVVPATRLLSTDVLVLLALGGSAYSGGVWFYLRRSLRYSHAYWHVAVLAGSALHHAAVYRHVLA